MDGEGGGAGRAVLSCIARKESVVVDTNADFG
jgi:hypothetical protein